ncbi:MAG: hypothetical protein AAF433_16990 [Bacteroidota bacterium]
MTETHPLFPAGVWEGFYTYREGPTATQCPMRCQMNFSEGQLSGSGNDNIGSFSWQGSYNKVAMSCTMTKSYTTHQVHYFGRVDENGIWGNWKLDNMHGGFHLWPQKATEEKEAIKEQQKEIIGEPVLRTGRAQYNSRVACLASFPRRAQEDRI